MIKNWKNRAWRRTIEGAVFWYELALSTRAPNAEVGLAQNALEILAWYNFVTRGRVEAENFDRSPAAKRIRELLSDFGIDVGVSADLTRLKTFAGQDDGPKTTTKVRNADAHPKHDNEVPFDIVNEAARLTLWHLEMCLLKMVGYQGLYTNRAGTYELEWVPWATDTTDD